MKNFLLTLPESIRRLGVVFLVLVGGFILVRIALPAEIKDNALHVKSTIEREIAKPVRHAGSEACTDCHDQNNKKNVGYHKNLSCETCHGAAKAHTENPGDIKPTLPKMREFCVRCHAFNPSRPTGFPQINAAAHNPLKPCISCHDPHDPKPPEVPRDCEGCHTEIARTKAISPHVSLECTTCHTASDVHKVSPRTVRPSIPSDRKFCGTCHETNSSVKETPKVDLATHGEKYLCWQCHYPHMPEVQ